MGKAEKAHKAEMSAGEKALADYKESQKMLAQKKKVAKDLLGDQFKQLALQGSRKALSEDAELIKSALTDCFKGVKEEMDKEFDGKKSISMKINDTLYITMTKEKKVQKKKVKKIEPDKTVDETGPKDVDPEANAMTE